MRNRINEVQYSFDEGVLHFLRIIQRIKRKAIQPLDFLSITLLADYDSGGLLKGSSSLMFIEVTGSLAQLFKWKDMSESWDLVLDNC